MKRRIFCVIGVVFWGRWLHPGGDVQERSAASPDGADRRCGFRREADYLRYYLQSLCFGEVRELRVVRFSFGGR